uniref:Cytochrome P450 4M1 n=1 Tax=Manduca sexta TaxID=7130 RepID=D5L0M0_MANSE|nr:cytochrome P450 4M1 [Manduca sexta]
MFIYLFAIIVILCVIHIIFNYNASARLLRRIPGPPDRFIVGNSPELLLSSVELMKLPRKYAERWAKSGICRFWTFPWAAVMIYDPKDIEIVLSGMKHHEKSVIYKFLSPWLGDGLLVSAGEKWQHRRKILTPAFHFNILRQFSVILEENSQRLVERLEKTVGQPIDVTPILSEFTLNSICETAMGTQLNKETTGAGKAYKDAIYELGQILVQRFISFHLYSDIIFFSTSLGRKLKKHLNALHRFTERVISDRKDYLDYFGLNFGDEIVDDDKFIYKKRKKTAMLDLLIAAERDGEIDSQGIQEEVDTFMFEGHDTTASGLTFCFMLLANNKHIQDKIVAELDDIFGDSTRPANMEDFAKMRYLECCIKESLRLYPPVHFISRNINEPVKLNNYEVPGGTSCFVFIYDLHRRSDLFKNPSVFDPDRFLPENSVGRHPYSYIPFSAGPRNCIGQKFAIMEMKSAVSEVLRKYELRPVTRPSDIEFIADIVLRNSGPVEVTFVKRQK